MKMIRRSLFFSSVVILLFLSSNAFMPGRQTDMNDDILSYTNSFRKSKNMSALVMRDDLNAIATTHSSNMAKKKVAFGHDGFDSRQAKAKKAIPDMTHFAENVAYGANTAKEVVTMWKNSSGHRRNMLGKYRYIGIGTARDKKGTIYYTQIFAN